MPVLVFYCLLVIIPVSLITNSALDADGDHMELYYLVPPLSTIFVMCAMVLHTVARGTSKPDWLKNAGLGMTVEKSDW